MKIQFVSEDAIMLYVGEKSNPQTSALVQAAATAIERRLGSALIDLVPSYASLLIIYDPLHSDHTSIAGSIREILNTLSTTTPVEGRTVVLPVYYAQESGMDLDSLAARADLTSQQVIDLHCSVAYQVYAIGFAPGFAYLGEVDERIAAPRLATPRAQVPRGAVAIADRQTAVYPAVSPGGWNLIGRCPVPMFEPQKNPAMPVNVGDRVQFEPVTRQQYLELGGSLT